MIYICTVSSLSSTYKYYTHILNVGTVIVHCEICMGCCKFELQILVSVKIIQYYFLFPLLCSLAYSYRFRLLISKFMSPIIG